MVVVLKELSNLVLLKVEWGWVIKRRKVLLVLLSFISIYPIIT